MSLPARHVSSARCTWAGALPWFWPLGRVVPTALWGRCRRPARAGAALRARLGAGLDEHARIGCARQWARGRLRWHLGYLFSKRFRWEEEKAAWWAWIAWRVRRGRPPEPAAREALVRLLAGPSYGYMTDRREAARFVAAALAQAGALWPYDALRQGGT